MKHYQLPMFAVSTLVIIITFFFIPQTYAQQSQDKIFSFEKPMISGGAEFNMFLQKQIKSGNLDKINNWDGRIPLKPNEPSAITTFDGFDFDRNTFFTGFRFIPPDPIGVGGLDRVVAVVNVMIECRNLAGDSLWQDYLQNFFSPLSPTTFTFDPKVIYDQYEDRFVVVTLERVDAGDSPNPGNISRILLAVSKDGTPASSTSADWWYFAINSEESIGGEDFWADYPGFAVDEEAVYITANMFPHADSVTVDTSVTRLWIIDKGAPGGFYDGSAASFSGPHDFPTISGGFHLTSQPAHVFGPSGVGGIVGTFLVGFSALTNGIDEFIQIVRVDNPITTPTFSTVEYVNIGNIDNLAGDLLDAPQMVSATGIEVNNRRALHSVWRNNSLWLTTTINPNSGPDAGETTAHWIQLNTSVLGATTLTDQGDVGGEDIAPGTFTFFPSIAVNSLGDAIIGFSASAQTIYAGAYYAGRYFNDPAGTVNPSVTIRAGMDYYVRTFGNDRNRWGDYTGTSVDPNDDQSFWVFNEYAITRGSGSPPEDGRWGTVYAHVPRADFVVGVKQISDLTIPDEMLLEQNYPNPFNPVTIINYSIPQTGFVTLDVYDLLGEKVASLVNQEQEAGRYEVDFDASELSSGIYVYRLISGSFSLAKKMILMK